MVSVTEVAETMSARRLYFNVLCLFAWLGMFVQILRGYFPQLFRPGLLAYESSL